MFVYFLSINLFAVTSMSLRDLPPLKIQLVALCKFASGKAYFISGAIFPLKLV